MKYHLRYTTSCRFVFQAIKTLQQNHKEENQETVNIPVQKVKIN